MITHAIFALLIITALSLVYLAQFIGSMNLRIFNYIILPFLCITVFILLFHSYVQDFTGNLIIAGAAIYSACIALFISKSEDFQRKSEEKRQSELRHSLIHEFLNEIIRSIGNEANNYTAYSDAISANYLMPNIPLKTTSFHFINRVLDLGSETIYKSLKKDLQQIQIIDLISLLEKALFIKSSTKEQHPTFISSFNGYSNSMSEAQYDINSIYVDIARLFGSSNPNDDLQGRKFVSLIDDYNRLMGLGHLDARSYDHVSNNLFAKLEQILIEWIGHTKTDFPNRINLALKKYDTSFTKLLEYQMEQKKYFAHCASELKLLNKKIENLLSSGD